MISRFLSRVCDEYVYVYLFSKRSTNARVNWLLLFILHEDWSGVEAKSKEKKKKVVRIAMFTIYTARERERDDAVSTHH